MTNLPEIIFEKKEMEYTGENAYSKPEILYGVSIAETDDDPPVKYTFLIINNRTHPCCYISIPKGRAIDINMVLCHGGITWNSSRLPNSAESLVRGHSFGDVWWIGWDYAHSDDYIYYGPDCFWDGKKWTTDELITDCFDVLNQLI